MLTFQNRCNKELTRKKKEKRIMGFAGKEVTLTRYYKARYYQNLKIIKDRCQ
jgi:hypothetical protein